MPSTSTAWTTRRNSSGSSLTSGEDLAGHRGRFGVAVGGEARLVLVDLADDDRAALLGAPVVVGDVAQRADEVGEVGAVGEAPWFGQDARVRFLCQILGQLRRAAQCAGDGEQAGTVVRRGLGIEERDVGRHPG